MKKRNKNILYAVFILSIIGNIITFSLDTYPYLYPKIKERYFPIEKMTGIDNNTENIIFSKSMKMASSPTVAMVWGEPKGVTREILSFRNITNTSEFRTYNYPRAFLYYGISEFLIKRKDRKSLDKFKNIFDELMNEDGKPSFVVNRVDQAPFGLAALNLYKVYSESKYVLFSDYLYKQIDDLKDDDEIINYRKGSEVLLNDVLGMAVPFLVEYSQIKNDSIYLNLAIKQLDYYIKHGVDKETYLPTHGINRNERVKIGPTNWGRGVGWYYIALASIYQETGEFKEEYDGLRNTLLSLSNSDNLWNQFPGGGGRFDASASTMFIYSILLNDNLFYNKQELLELLKPYISVKGEILQTSGDTFGLNRYSHSFGKSELSQGFLLLALSLIED